MDEAPRIRISPTPMFTVFQNTDSRAAVSTRSRTMS